MFMRLMTNLAVEMTSRDRTDLSALVVRYRPDARAEFTTKLTPVVRKQAKATVVLGVWLTLMMVGGPIAAFALGGEPLSLRIAAFLGVMAVLPAVVTVAGARRLRFIPELPEVALTVTQQEIIFGPLPRLTTLGRGRPELRWPRNTTQAELIGGAGPLSRDRIRFTTRARGWRRTVNVALEPLDTSGNEVISALER